MGLFDNFNFDKLKAGLNKTRSKLVSSITEIVTGKAFIDDKTLEDIEEVLISSDIGYKTAEAIIENTRIRLKDEKDRSNFSLIETVKKELISQLSSFQFNGTNDKAITSYKPYVILIVGINGAGKTTTVGKLANNFKKGGLRVLIGAADTFRAAANEQLEIWAERAGVEICKKLKGSDPSAVAFDTLSHAVKEEYDLVLIDTAGRLQSKTNLMEELKKIRKVMNKQLSYAPNETLLILDGTTGQNAIAQVEEFSKIIDITGLVITKLDGTAKGGVVFQICSTQKIPVRYIGVGEGLDDLQNFDPAQFVAAIFE